jgi:hypothetical protein
MSLNLQRSKYRRSRAVGALWAPVDMCTNRNTWQQIFKTLHKQLILKCFLSLKNRNSCQYSDWAIPAGRSGFDSRRGLGIFLFSTMSRRALRPTQPPTPWVPGVLSWGQSGRGAKLTTHLNLVPRSKNMWSYTSTLPISLHGVVSN